LFLAEREKKEKNENVCIVVQGQHFLPALLWSCMEELQLVFLRDFLIDYSTCHLVAHFHHFRADDTDLCDVAMSGCV
jgi:hypothetical protein